MKELQKPLLLYIQGGGDVSDTASQLRNLLAAVDRGKFQLRVLLAEDEPSREIFETLNIPVDDVLVQKFTTHPEVDCCRVHPHIDWMALLPNRKLDRYLRQVHPNVVHIIGQSLLQAGLSCKRVGVPVIWHVQSAALSGQNKLSTAVSGYVISQCADHIIVDEEGVTPFDRDRRAILIHNSLDLQDLKQAALHRSELREKYGLDADGVLIGMVGCLCEHSGAWDFIQAAGMIQHNLRDTSVRFMIVDPLPEWEDATSSEAKRRENKARHLAWQAGIENDFLMVHGYQDLLALINTFDITVFFSPKGRLGGLGQKIMATGSPVVMVSSKNAIQGKQLSLVTSPRDVISLADIVTRLASDPALRQQMRSKAAQSEKWFDPAQNARALEELDQQILGFIPA